MRLDAYIRVSSVRGREGETFISPDVQEERIRAWAALHGHEIIAAHHELDVSGGKMDRPLLNEVMRRIEAGETEGVVVHKLDRFGRTIAGSIDLIDRISSAGALFASVDDNFDITTPNGELFLNLMLSLAQWELRRIRSSWRTARDEAVARGWHVSGTTPFGYTRAKVRPHAKTGKPTPYGPLVPDPATAPLATEIFRRRAAGDSQNSIRDWLNSTGVLTARGKSWSLHHVRSVLGNRAYLGRATDGVAVRDDAHEPLTDPATWHAAQPRSAGPRGTDAKPSAVLTRGLVRCGACRYVMAAKPRHIGGVVVAHDYICPRNMTNGAGACASGTTIVAIGKDGGLGIDDIIMARMWDKLAPVEHEGVDLGAASDLAALEAAAEAAEWELEQAATDTDLERQLGRRLFRARVDAFKAEADTKRAAYEEALRLRGGLQLDRPVHELRRDWESGELPREDMRRLLVNTVQTVFVAPSYAWEGETRSPSLPRNSVHVTQADVARRVGVSRSTVSLALLDKGGVGAETVERVRQAARELGYKADAAIEGSGAVRPPEGRAPTSRQLAELVRLWGPETYTAKLIAGDLDDLIMGREPLPVELQPLKLRRRRLAERLHIVWADEAAVDVPRQGRRDWTPEPFIFPAESDPNETGIATL